MSTDTRLKLEFLCEKQIALDNQSYFLGKGATTQTDTSDGSYFVNNILSYSVFDSKWLPASVATLPTPGQIAIRAPKNKKWYKTGSFTAADTETITGLTTQYKNLQNLTKEIHINYTDLLKTGGSFASTRAVSIYSSSTNNTTSFSNLLDLLNTLRVTYNVIGEKYYALFKTAMNASKTTIVTPVPIYELETDSTGTMKYKTVSDMAEIRAYIQKIIPNIDKLDTSTTNLDAIRRILFGYELMIHIYIAAKLVSTLTYDSTNNTVVGTNATLFLNLLSSMIKQLKDFNDAIYKKSGMGSVGQLNDLLEARITEYNRSKASIEEANKTIDDVKLGINLESNNVDSNKSFLLRNNVVFYSIVFICVVCAIMLLIAQQGVITDNVGTNKAIALSVTAIGMVSLVVMYIVNKKVLYEPFEVNTLNNFIAIYTNQALQAFNEYVANSLYLSLVINTYKRYGDISYAISKEQNYYDNASIYLKQNEETLQSIQVDTLRKARVLQYRIYLLLQVLITISIASVVTIYSNSVSLNMLLVITVLVILVWVYFYILNTQGLVHTDSTKIYWNQPLIDKDM